MDRYFFGLGLALRNAYIVNEIFSLYTKKLTTKGLCVGNNKPVSSRQKA